MTGHTEMLDMRSAVDHWKAKNLDYSRILYKPNAGADVAIRQVEAQDHGLDKALDHKLIADSRQALENQQPVRIETDIRNFNVLSRHALRQSR